MGAKIVATQCVRFPLLGPLGCERLPSMSGYCSLVFQCRPVAAMFGAGKPIICIGWHGKGEIFAGRGMAMAN